MEGERCMANKVNYVVASRIRKLRNSRFETQKVFANKVGIPQSTLSSYEAGKINPSVEVLTKIASTCNVTVDWLCGRTLPFRMGNLGEAMSAFIGLFEAQEIMVRPTFHEVENEADDETDDEKRSWVELKIYRKDRTKGEDPLFNWNSDLCDIIKKAYKYTEELRRYELSQDDYCEDVDKVLTDYQLHTLSRVDHDGLPEEERRLRMLAIMKAEWEAVEKKRQESGEGPLEFKEYKPPVIYETE